MVAAADGSFTYVVSGKVIPERTNFHWPPVQASARLGEVNTNIYFCVLMSQIIMHVIADGAINTADLRNFCYAFAGNIINVAGFFQVRAFAHDIESLTLLETGHSEVSGVEGYVFDSRGAFSEKISFRPADESGVSVSIVALQDPFLARARFELHSAIRYVEYTALHCRLAVESIRNAFGENENLAWIELRRSLCVSREAIESFKTTADEQRHGRNVAQSWESRRDAMQVAWEIAYRYHKYIDAGANMPLTGVPTL